MVQVSAGGFFTCVLFETGRTLCFGQGSAGQLGSSSGSDIDNGDVSLAPLISFSDNANLAADIILGYKHSCIVRCNGAVTCFGSNVIGEIGLGFLAGDYGTVSTDIINISPVGFDPVKIPPGAPLCAARIVSLVDSAGAMTGFSSLVTTYVIGVRGTVDSLAFSSVVTAPATASVSANNLLIRDPTPLALFAAATQVS